MLETNESSQCQKRASQCISRMCRRGTPRAETPDDPISAGSISEQKEPVGARREVESRAGAAVEDTRSRKS